MAFANKVLLAAVVGLLLPIAATEADRNYFDETVKWQRGDIEVVAKGKIRNNGYEFALDFSPVDIPPLYVGDKVTITNLGSTTFSPVTWWQNGREYKGTRCSGLFRRRCTKTYYNHQNRQPDNYRASDVRFGLRRLDVDDPDPECLDTLEVAPGEELVVSFPSRLCVNTEGRFPKPEVVAGPGRPDGPVRVQRMIGSAGQGVLIVNVRIVREQ